MPLEHPYQFNGITLQDQSKRNYSVPLPGPPLFGATLRAAALGESLRSLTSGLYSGAVHDQDGLTGIYHFPFAGVHIVEPGRFWNNGRPDTPPSGVTHGGVLGFNIGGDPLVDYQQAANYQAALDSTIGITAADVGLETNHAYYVMFSYRVQDLTTAVPRIGWHNTTLTDVAPKINTTDPLIQDSTFSGLHRPPGGAAFTVWPTGGDEFFVRAFHVGAAGGAIPQIVIEQIYFLDFTSAAKSKFYFAGQELGGARGTLTWPVTSDAGASNYQGTGPPPDALEDTQHTDTPAVTEANIQFYGLPRPAGGGPGDDRVLYWSQPLIAARATHDTDPFGAHLTDGRLAMTKNGGPRVNYVSPLNASWMFWFLPVLLEESHDFATQDAADLYAYTPAAGTVGAHTDIMAFTRAPAPAPTLILDPPDGSVQGPNQTDIDGLVHWDISAIGPLLRNLEYEVLVTPSPGYSPWGDWSLLGYEGGGVWDAANGFGVYLDPLTQPGDYTVEVRGYYSDDPTVKGESSFASFTVGQGDPPADPVLDCPSGPVASGTVTFTWAEGTGGTTPTDHYTYSLDGATPVETTALSVTFTGLAPGAHTFTVEAWDSAGDHSAVQTCAFVVDTASILPFGSATPRDGCGVTDAAWGSLDGSDWWIEVKQINGLWDADVRDERYPKPGQSGERSVDDFYGGKPISANCIIHAKTLAALRRGQRAVQLAFGDLGMHRFYYQSIIDDAYYFLCARKVQAIDMAEEQTTGDWRRGFTVTLRGDDPRGYSVVLHHEVLTIGLLSGSAGGHLREYDIQTAINLGGTNDLRMRSYDQPTTPRTRIYGTPGVAGGARATILNAGTAETYPISVIHGPISGGLTYTNLTNNESLIWLAGLTLGAGESLLVDHGYDEMYRNGSLPLDFTGFDAVNSDFWPLEPGVNEIAALPFASGDGASIDIYWRDALR